jgi:hypothetical protein
MKSSMMLLRRRFNEVIPILDTQVEIQPQDPVSLMKRATCLRHLGLFTDAINDLFAALKHSKGESEEPRR